MVLLFVVLANTAAGGITADWNSTTKKLTVTCTSQNGDIVQITKDGSNNGVLSASVQFLDLLASRVFVRQRQATFFVSGRRSR